MGLSLWRGRNSLLKSSFFVSRKARKEAKPAKCMRSYVLRAPRETNRQEPNSSPGFATRARKPEKSRRGNVYNQRYWFYGFISEFSTLLKALPGPVCYPKTP